MSGRPNQRDARQRHGRQGADERSARRDAKAGQQLDAHDGAEHAQHHGEDEVVGRERARVRARDRNLVFESRSGTSASRCGFAVEKDSRDLEES
jgi:hypothetical protein